METRDIPKELGLFYAILLTSHYISGGKSLLFSRSTFQHHLIGWPQVLYWFLKGCIWTYWALWLFWLSRSLLEITLPDSKSFRLCSNQKFQIQPSKKQEYCFPDCLYPIKTKYISSYSLAIFHVSVSRLKMAKKVHVSSKSEKPFNSPFLAIFSLETETWKIANE